jgi:HEAT repeat protein
MNTVDELLTKICDRHPDFINDRRFQHLYLNHLEWTESIATILADLADREQVLRIVRLAVDVDWMLGARLTGAVQSQLRTEAIEIVRQLDVPKWLNLKLIYQTRAKFAISEFSQRIKDGTWQERDDAVDTLINMGVETDISLLLQAIESQTINVKSSAIVQLVTLKPQFTNFIIAKAAASKKHLISKWDSLYFINNSCEDIAPIAVIKVLETIDEDNCEDIIEILGKINMPQVIAILLELIECKSTYIRWATVEALAQIGSIPALIIASKSRSALIRRRVVDKLGDLHAQSAIPNLIELLQDSSSRVRYKAIKSLRKIGYRCSFREDLSMTIPALIPMLEDPSDWVRTQAAVILGDLQVITIVPNLITMLTDKNDRVRNRSADALGKMGDRSVIPALIETLLDPIDRVRRSAIEALMHLKAAEAIPNLIIMLSDRHQNVRRNAAYALEKLEAKEAIPFLENMLGDPDYQVRNMVLRVLEKLKIEVSIDKFTDAFQDPNPTVRQTALKGLSKTDSTGIIPILFQAFQDEDCWMRQIAAAALKKQHPRDILDGLIQISNHQNPQIRKDAVRLLGEIKFDRVIPTLLKSLQDEDANVRQSAAYALDRIGNDRIIINLVKSSKHGDEIDREHVKSELAKIPSPEIVAALLNGLQDPDANVRRAVADALANMQVEIAIPYWLDTLTSLDSYLRTTAVSALGKLQVETAIPQIFTAITDKSETVRRSAVVALGVFKNDLTAHLLPDLRQLIPTKFGEDAFDALTRIQNNCGFYNYDILTVEILSMLDSPMEQLS